MKHEIFFMRFAQFNIFLTSLCFFFSCKNPKSFFEELPASQTNIHFENKLEKRELFNILYYLYYYNGGGVATGDINNDGLPDIYFTANSKGNNKLYLNKGNFKFEDITNKAGVAGTADWCTGVTMADVNSDGFLDIYVSSVSNTYRLKGNNILYINNGNGTFTDRSKDYGLDFSGFTTQSGFFDYDNDGDLDCYILNQSQRPHANIVDTSNRKKIDPNAGDRLYRNDLNGPQKKFTDVTSEAGIYQSSLGYGLGLAFADINNDGWDDIYVGNDFHENDYYYVNNGNGTFSENGAKHFRHYSRFSMGNDVADFNNDGQLDVITVDMLPPDEKVLKTYGSDENPDVYKMKLEIQGYQKQYSKNCLQRNNGNGESFSEISLLSGVAATDWSWAPLFADFDNDGNKDLFVSSGIVKRPVDLDYVRFISDLKAKGMDKTDAYDDEAINAMPDGSSYPFIFKGNGEMAFTDVSKEWGTGKMKGYFTGASYADLDNDGRLDLVINCINAPAVILKNRGPQKNYISLSFRGDSVNTTGVGTKAYLFAKEKMQYQQLMPTRGFQSSSDHRLHFGLDSAQTIDSMLIVWPDQQFQVLKNVAVNKQLVISKSGANGKFEYNNFFPAKPSLLEELPNTIAWSHKENDFLDYNVQYLIPHVQSTRGPKIAVADVNGDGLDDFYACAATGQAGMLMIQQKNGSFAAGDKEVFAEDISGEDVDAVFFDANGDGSPDLYVANGGNQYSTGTNLQDRLYINDGKGHFTKSGSSLPQLQFNKSSIAVADFDKDGDQDIFVGVLANARAFGIPQTSYLLVNDGKAGFSIASNDVIALANLGIVTSSSFADINNDGWSDLVVAGEWMSIIVFINENGKFKTTSLPNSTGLWQTVFLDDANGDGNIDILAGNWGFNNKFWSGKNGPARLYVADFDHNGQTEQLLSYTLENKEYPFLAKDEVERPLPLLKKHYLYYSEYAGVPMKDVFYGWIDTIQPFTAERLGSVVCYGDGKGGFSINDLPPELQMAPIFSFRELNRSANESVYIAGGNFYDVIPYEGRYDAQPLALFAINKSGQCKPVFQSNLTSLNGQVRDIKWLNAGQDKKVLTVACNNDKLMTYKVR